MHKREVLDEKGGLPILEQHENGEKVQLSQAKR